MINDADVILHPPNGRNRSKQMCRERENPPVPPPKVKPGIPLTQFSSTRMVPPYFGDAFIVRLVCQADLPLDPEACESHESTLGPATVLYS